MPKGNLRKSYGEPNGHHAFPNRNGPEGGASLSRSRREGLQSDKDALSLNPITGIFCALYFIVVIFHEYAVRPPSGEA